MTQWRYVLRVTGPTGDHLRVAPDYCVIFAFVAPRWVHVLDAAVTVIDVVPVQEAAQASAVSRPTRPREGNSERVHGGGKLRLRVGVVIAHPG